MHFRLSILALSACFFLIAPSAPAASATTTTALAMTSGGSAVSTVPPGTVITLSATVKAGTTTLTRGQVSFCDATEAYCTDIHLLFTAQITAAGTATYKFIPGAGSHSYKAIFLGNTADASSASPAFAMTVIAPGHTGLFTSGTALVHSGNAGNFTLTATVSGVVNKTGVAAPTGTISFVDTSNGNAELGSAPLGDGAPGLTWKTTANFRKTIAGYPRVVVTGDFDGDGTMDAAFGDGAVLLGNGDGTFTAAGPAVVQNGGDVVAADFNGDGKLDLALSAAGIVLLGKGDGTFAPPIGLPAGGTTIAAADFNRDGIEDLAVLSNLGGTGGLSILLGNGDGSFALAPPSSLSIAPYPTSLVTGDFNGDGAPDLAFGSDMSNTVTVLIGNGDGTFRGGSTPSTGGGEVFQISVGDLNGDGKLDLVDVAFADNGGLSVSAFLGNGDGTFTLKSTNPIQHNSMAVSLADFDGDGNADLVVADGIPLSLAVLLGNGDGTFRNYRQFTVGNSPGRIGVADFNGDGRPDFILTDRNFYRVYAVVTELTSTASASINSVAVNGAEGNHSVIAKYPGDTLFKPSMSTALSLVVATTATFSPSRLDFGNQPLNKPSGLLSVTLTNTGPVTLLLYNGITIAGDNPSSFTTSNNCNFAVAVHSSCTINVRFTPKAAGTNTAFLSIPDNTVVSPQTVPLTGVGSVGPPVVVLSAANLTFTGEPYGVASPVQTVTLSNTGDTVLTLSMALTGPDASSFLFSSDCGSKVAAQTTCTIRVRLDPRQNDALTAALNLTDNAAKSPQSIALSGYGPQGAVTFSVPSLTFAPQTINTESDVQRVSITNTGKAPLHIFSIGNTGPHPRQYLLNNQCPATLALHATCTIRVRFYPRVHGTLDAALTVTDDASESPQSLALNGSTLDPLTTASVSAIPSRQ